MLLLHNLYVFSSRRKSQVTHLLWADYATILTLVTMSRMYIAAHFPHQCLLGALLGNFSSIDRKMTETWLSIEQAWFVPGTSTVRRSCWAWSDVNGFCSPRLSCCRPSALIPSCWSLAVIRAGRSVAPWSGVSNVNTSTSIPRRFTACPATVEPSSVSASAWLLGNDLLVISFWIITHLDLFVTQIFHWASHFYPGSSVGDYGLWSRRRSLSFPPPRCHSKDKRAGLLCFGIRLELPAALRHCGIDSVRGEEPVRQSQVVVKSHWDRNRVYLMTVGVSSITSVSVQDLIVSFPILAFQLLNMHSTCPVPLFAQSFYVILRYLRHCHCI